MRIFVRTLSMLIFAAAFVAPMHAAAAPGVTQVAQATSATTGGINGVITDEGGAPVSGAAITLRGVTTLQATSDAKGAFQIGNIPAGVYAISARKAGYEAANETDFAVFSGEVEKVSITLQKPTFTSLQTIATVKVNGRGTINTSAASVDVVSAQAFLNQSQPQVTRVLSQIPGLQISFPSNSANAAAPGAITIPNIRGATSYETASLIDGHPISVGQYGDNVTTFLNTFMFGSVEVIKGPGADSPVVNNAIGGTTNFRTKDPTQTITPDVVLGIDSRGGAFSNFGISDTLGKVGFVVDVATLNDPSALSGKQVYYDPSFGSYQGSTLFSNSNATQLNPTGSFLYNQTSLLACCYTLSGALDQNAELVKLRYKFSGTTTLTASYLGSQSTSDQNGNTSAFITTQFIPGDPTYNGSLKPGILPVANIFPGAYSGESNNESIVQAEINTSIGNDAILARFYHASISRFQFQGSSATLPDSNNVTLFGVAGGYPTFNGTPATVSYYDFFQEPELDRLSGGSFEYQHPLGQEDLLTFSVDRTYSQTSDYTYNAQPPGGGSPAVSFNLPPGTNQTLTTYLLRGHFYFGHKVDATISDYLNTYNSVYPINCPMDAFGNCTAAAATTGAGVTFQSTNLSHNDPRLGVVYRPNANSSVRLALGSSIAPPFLGLLNQITSAPSYNGTNAAIETQSNGNLRPETGFGYDLGGDLRLKDGLTTISGDLYLTNLYNRFFGQTIATGQTCDTVACSGAGIPPNTPVLNQTNTNISNARFEGAELTIKRSPTVGFGYNLSGSLLRGYYYNLPANFYCSFLVTPATPCIPSTYNQNLNIISGQNTNGISVGNYPLNASISYNGNMRIPYSQAYAEASYTFANGAYASLGETVFGHNNSLNEPAFGIANATLRYPLSKTLALQISGDNIFNAYPGYLPIYGGGVPIQLAAPAPCPPGLASCAPGSLPALAATNGNVLGPATYRFSLSLKLP